MVHEIEGYNSASDYLRDCGFEVVEMENGLIEIFTNNNVERDGEMKQISFVVDPNDVSEIVGDVYNASNDVEEVFDEYVVERNFNPIN